MVKKKEGEFDKLTRIVERGFAVVADEFVDVKKKMATKDDLHALKRRMADTFDFHECHAVMTYAHRRKAVCEKVMP